MPQALQRFKDLNLMKEPIHPKVHPRMNLSAGFTMTELLVVIALIIALAVITAGVMRNVRTGANKVADMNNLRNLATAAMVAGNDNAGRLPQIHDQNSLYPYYLVGRDKLEAAGIFKEFSYAPTRNITGGAPEYEWWTRNPANTPVHYVYCANDANTPGSAWFLKNGTVTKPEKSEYRGAIPYETIIEDKTKAFARNLTDDSWYSVLWVGICRDYAGTKVAALMNNGEPLGVNAMYLDGHAEWIPKKRMKARYVGGGVTVYF